jgi:hypothetical protein
MYVTHMKWTHMESYIERAPQLISHLKSDDVRVLQLLEQRDLPDRSRGDALLLRLEPDLLHGHNLARLLVLSLEDDAVGALANLLDLHIVLQLCRICRVHLESGFGSGPKGKLRSKVDLI